MVPIEHVYFILGMIIGAAVMGIVSAIREWYRDSR